MSYEWGRDQRFKYDGEGRQIGWADGYEELMRQESGGAARSEASSGGSAGTVICFGLLALGWAIQQLRARFPLWQLFLLVLGIASVSSWLVRRQLRRSSDWSSRAVSVIGALVFVAVAVLLGAMVYDLDHLGVLALGVLIALFILFVVLGLALHVLSAIARHPIRTAFFSIIGSWLIWVIFIQKPEHTATTAPHPSQNTARQKVPARRSTKTSRQSPSHEEPRPAPAVGAGHSDAGSAQPVATSTPDSSTQPSPERSESAAKNPNRP